MKQTSVMIKIAIALFDITLIGMAFVLAYALRFADFSLTNIDNYSDLFYLSVPIIIIALLFNDVLTGYRYKRLSTIIFKTLMSFIVAGVLSSTILFLAHIAEDYSRLMFGLYFGLATLFVVGEKTIIKLTYDHYLKSGKLNIKLIIIGYGNKYEQIITALEANPVWGLKILQAINPKTTSLNEIFAQIKQSGADEVYLSCPRDDYFHQTVDPLIKQLENFGLPVKITLNFDDISSIYNQQHCSIAGFDGIQLSHYNLDPDQLIIKRIIDLAGGIAGFILLSIMYIPIAIAIKLEDPGPIFFKQQRVGKGGRLFYIYKFRSMVQNAEALKEQLQKDNIHSGQIFKVKHDPRITKAGHFLRKTSLDEFPQFLNVLSGDMSLVGTRPPTQDEVEKYEARHHRRISMKPGLTGLWQISGRNKIKDFDKIVELDVNYIKHWTPFFDLKIILKTALLVFRGDSRGI